jgi:hypothetical protein
VSRDQIRLILDCHTSIYTIEPDNQPICTIAIYMPTIHSMKQTYAGLFLPLFATFVWSYILTSAGTTIDLLQRASIYSSIYFLGSTHNFSIRILQTTLSLLIINLLLKQDNSHNNQNATTTNAISSEIIEDDLTPIMYCVNIAIQALLGGVELAFCLSLDWYWYFVM